MPSVKSGSDNTSDKTVPPREYVFGPFRINLPYCQLLREGQLVPLTPKAFDTLVFLVAHRDHVVSKEELMTAIWPDAFVSEDALTQNIWAIRRALGDDAEQQAFIATLPRRGYRFMATVVETTIESTVENVIDLAQKGNPAKDAAPSDGPPSSEPTAEAAGDSPALVARAIAVPVTSVRSVYGRRAWYALAVAAMLFAAAWVATVSQRGAREATSSGGVVRFTQDSPADATLVSGGVLSPDGRQLAFVAQDERTGKTQVWLRGLDAAEPRPLPGTEGASRPFWSADSRYIGFFADSSLRRVGLVNDEPRTLAPVAGIRSAGASWSRRDQILFAGSNRSGLSVIPASGGTPRPVTTLNARDLGHRWPHFLPDGRHFLYSIVSGNASRSGVYLGDLDSESPHVRLLDDSVASAIYASPGYLLYVRDGLLMAHPFDASTLRLTGDAESIASNVRSLGIFSDTVLSATADGLLTFGGDTSLQRLVWMDRTGNQLGGIDAALVNLSFSPDGRQLIGNGGDLVSGVWWLDLQQGVPTRIVPEGFVALWSPDGSRIAYAAMEGETSVLHFKSMETAGGNTRFWGNPRGLYINTWSPDLRYIVFVMVEANGKQTLWLLPTTKEAEPVPYSPSPANQIQAQVAPDGQTIAYASDESGIWEVYVDTFPTPGKKRRVSIDGGTQPQWSRSGSELFYLGLDRNLMVIDFAGGEAGRPRALFKAPVLGVLTNYRNYYAVAPDGRRFLFSASTYEPISVLSNWTAGLMNKTSAKTPATPPLSPF